MFLVLAAVKEVLSSFPVEMILFSSGQGSDVDPTAVDLDSLLIRSSRTIPTPVEQSFKGVFGCVC